MEVVAAVGSIYTIYQIASFVSQACFNYAQCVKHASTDADVCLYEIQNFQRSLIHLKGMLQEEELNKNKVGERFQTLTEIMHETSLLTTIHTDLKNIQEKLRREEQQNLSGTFKVLMRKLKWPIRKDDVEKLINNMKAVAGHIDRAQGFDNSQILRNIDDTTKAHQSQLQITDSRVQLILDLQLTQEEQKQKEVAKRKMEETREEIFTWLKHPDPAENHDIALKARNKNTQTGRWFLDSSNYDKFNKENRSLVWLHGDPGCGKTILSSTIIENIRAKRADNSKVALAYWYFNCNEKAKTTFENCVIALLVQLLTAMSGTMSKTIKDLWTARGSQGGGPKTLDMTLAAQNLIIEERLTYFIVIDALDEAQEGDRHGVLAMLLGMLTTEHPDVHVLITSRKNVKDQFFEQFRDKALFIDVAIAREKIDEDIRLHITEQLQNDRNLAKFDEGTKANIFSTLSAKADGMFRWADCQLKALSNCSKKSAVKKVLANLPKNLEEQYQKDLANVPCDYQKEVRDLLRWLTYPQRKIRVDEAIHLLAVDYDDPSPHFDEDEVLNDLDRIFSLCGSLIRLDMDEEGTDRLGNTAKVETLTTSHTTVLEYLTTRPVKIGSLPEMYFDKSEINYQMAITCLAYLHSLCEVPGGLDAKKLEEWPCARFCAQYWDDYYREAVQGNISQEAKTRLNQQVVLLLDSKNALLQCIQLSNPNETRALVNFERNFTHLECPLYYASLHGLLDVVEHYIAKHSDVNYKTPRGYGTPLAAAAYFGRSEVVSVLLKAGANPNIWGAEMWGRPLAVAVASNKADVVRILLSHPDVDVNCTRRGNFHEDASDVSRRYTQDETMVYIAAEYGSSDALEVLLEHYADVNRIGGRYHTPLQAACVSAREKIIETLLTHPHCARADIYGGDADNALLAACRNMNNSGLIQRIIDAGADVNRVARSGIICTPLYAASRSRDKDTVETLLKNGAKASINTRNCDTFDNALQGACERGDPAIVKILLENGADVNLFGSGKFDNCLDAAAAKGHASVAGLLLEHGMSPNQKGGRLTYPLIRACYECAVQRGYYDDIVEVLLEKKADPALVVEEGDYQGLSALCFASTEAQFASLKKHGADINEQFERWGNALWCAVTRNRPDLVHWLVNNGVNARQKGKDVGYALGTACDRGYGEMVKILIPCTDVNAMDDHTKGSALHAALRFGSLDIVELLVEAGADPKLVHWSSGSILMCASLTNKLDVLDRAHELMGKNHEGTNDMGQNGLLTASKSGQWSSANKLLTYGHDVHARDRFGRTCIHYAAAKGGLDFIKEVIERTLDEALIHSIDNNGWTVLHWAAASNHDTTMVIQYLIEHGVDRQQHDKQGRSALDLALYVGNATEAAIIRKPGIMELLFSTVPGKERQSKVWRSAYCDGCGNSRGSRYHCKTCYDFDFCFRCMLDVAIVHFPEHEFNLVSEDQPITTTTTSLERDTAKEMPTLLLHEGDRFNKLFTDLKYEEGRYELRAGLDMCRCYAIGNHAFSVACPYFEVSLDVIGSSEECELGIGLVASTAFKEGMVGWKIGSWGYHSDDGQVYFESGLGAKCARFNMPFKAGDVVGCGLDQDVYDLDPETRAVFFTKNGLHLGRLVIDLHDEVFPAVTTRGSMVGFRVNFGQNGEKDFVWKRER